MLLERLRRCSRLVATLLVLALVGAAPHVAREDQACLPLEGQVFGDHAETEHALRAGDHQEPDHCAVCHWTRSLRAPAVTLAVGAVDCTTRTRIARGAGRELFPPLLALLPARAPPLRLL